MLDEAVRGLYRGHPHRPPPGAAFFYRSVAWHAHKEPAKALADLDEAIRLDPTLGRAYHNRGVLRRGQGDSTGR